MGNETKEIQKSNNITLLDYQNLVEQGLLPDGKTILEILPTLLILQQNKELFYGDSWRKRGHLSAFMNLARKFDRMECMFSEAVNNSGVDELFDENQFETFLDTVADLTVYGLLWTSFIAKEYPGLWEKFLKSNKLNK